MAIILRQHQAFVDFLTGIKDGTVRAVIAARVERLALGNAGDAAPVGGGVFELRIHLGAGWRVYYGKVDDQIILLVGGGNKHGQQRDIEVARQRFFAYRNRY